MNIFCHRVPKKIFSKQRWWSWYRGSEGRGGGGGSGGGKEGGGGGGALKKNRERCPQINKL